MRPKPSTNGNGQSIYGYLMEKQSNDPKSIFKQCIERVIFYAAGGFYSSYAAYQGKGG
jgi:hypothetical protein